MIDSFLQKRLFKDWFLTLELSKGCNLRCPSCPQRATELSFSKLPYSFLIDILNDISRKKISFSSLTPFFRGEPFLNPEFVKQLRLILLYNYHLRFFPFFTIHTNGLLVTEADIKEIFSWGKYLDYLELVVSVDAINEETYQKIRSGGNLNRVIKNIKMILALYSQKNYPVSLVIQFVENPLNQSEKEEFFNFWSDYLKERGIDFKIIREGEVVLKDLSGIYLQIKKGSEIVRENQNRREKFFCVKPWVSPIISVDGRITFCCADYALKFLKKNKLRDYHNSLLEFWYGDEMEKIRNLFLKGEAPNETCFSCLKRGDNLLLDYV